MIRVEDLAFAFAARSVLSDVEFEIRRGEIVGILGPNGSGKTTLLRLVRGVLVPTRGRVVMDGRSVHRYSRKEAAQRISVVPQRSSADFAYPVQEFVAMGRYARSRSLWGTESSDREAVRAALGNTDIGHLASRPVTELSGGEFQRVVIARALAQKTPVLLLDEATSHLDLDHRVEVASLILRLNRAQGTTVVHVSHDMDLAAEISHRLLLLGRDGRPVAWGEPKSVLTKENLTKVYRIDMTLEPNPRTGNPRVIPTIGSGGGGDLTEDKGTLPPPSWQTQTMRS